MDKDQEISCRSEAEGHKNNATLNKQLNRSDHNWYHNDNNNKAWRCGTYSEGMDKDKNKSSSSPITFTYVVPPIIKTILAKSDSGASQNYFKNEYKVILINTKLATN